MTLTINGTDVADLGLAVTSLADWWATAVRTRAVVEVPGVHGGVPSPVAQSPPRRIPLEWRLDTTVAGRVAALRAIHDHLAGLCEVAVADDPDLVAYGVVEGVDARGAWGGGSSGAIGDLDVRPEIVCYDPAKYDRRDRVVGLGTTPVAVDLGPLPSAWGAVVEVYGAATPVVDPAVQFMRARTREVYATVTLDGASLDADDAAEVHLGDHDIVTVAAGVRTRNLDLLAPGAGGFPALQPGRVAGCVVKLTAASGTPTGRLRYRRAHP